MQINRSKSVIHMFLFGTMATSFSAFGQNANLPKPATSYTQQANEAWYAKLNFKDSLDFLDATKGFIATVEGGTIKDNQGKVLVDVNTYAFIKGKAPATVNPALWRQARLNTFNGLFKVTEGVYEVRGLNLANILFVETNSGYLVIDPLTNQAAAKAAFDLVKKYVGDKPVVAVISTHSHGDHYGGIEGVVDAKDIASGKIKYITPQFFYDEAVSESVLLGNAMGRRATYQFGSTLPVGEKQKVDAGVGKSYGGSGSSLLKPTHEITQTGERLNVDGVELVFQLTPDTEAPAVFTFAIPSKKVFFAADQLIFANHNILTPRGAKVRDAKAWAHYIDEAMDLFGNNIDIVIPGHNWPIYGKERSLNFLEKQRDLYKYTHDQTVHLANKGLGKEEIAEQIKLPEELAKEWFNQDFYGTINHNAKAVYQYYLGWWEGNPADYYKLPYVESAKKHVEWFGGEEAILKKAKISYDKGEYRWVAEVVKYVVYANPKNQAARNLQADAFEQIGYQSISAIWRNIFLTGAKELREGTPKEGDRLVPRSARYYATLTPEAIFDYLSISVDGNKAAGKNISVRVIFSDLNQNFLVYLKNGVLHHTVARPLIKADFTLTISKEKFGKLLSNEEKAIEVLGSPEVKYEGNPLVLKELKSVLEPFPSNWNVIEP